MSIADNYNRVADQIKDAALRIGRNPEEIRIVTVTKTFPAPVVQEAIDAGIGIFGENRVQEAKGKIPDLKGNFSFHLVGHLQSNKAKDAVRLFDLIHSLDRLSTAEKVNLEAERAGKIQKVLVQVNTSGEETKSGARPEGACDLCRGILRLGSLKLLGLMTIGPLTDDEGKVRDSFKLLKKILDDINRTLTLDIKELSMGMSSDFLIAVEEGATMVRIGSAILGHRSY